jgi:NAD(P) transhydrogenase subunit alpha
MDALTSMSTVTGYRSVLLAATMFPRFVPVIGTAVGTTRPARFLILGAGVVGLQAIATAKRLGGVITTVDIRAEAREQAASLGAKPAGFDVPAAFAVGEGGYARALPDEWLRKEREFLEPVLRDADIVISSALVPGERAPVLITPEAIRKMKPGSVIVDVSIDQGGNCARTVPGETTVVDDVVICGIQNIPGGMPVDASWLFAGNILHCVQRLFPKGPGGPALTDEVAKSMLVTHDGTVVHAGTLKAMREIESGRPTQRVS